jgi:FkbM family methyltransferase
MVFNIDYIFDKKILIDEECIHHNKYTWYPNINDDKILIEKFYNLVSQKENATIVDIGAQSGLFTLMANFLEKTDWYAFEPEPINFSLLFNNIKINDIKNVKIFQNGISDTNDILKLNVCKNHYGLNTIGNNLIRFNKDESYQVEIETYTLDSFFENIHIDFIKIDTEGCEFNILKGGKNIIKKYKPIILLEYEEQNINQFNKTLKELNDFIENELEYEIIENINNNIFIKSKNL